MKKENKKKHDTLIINDSFYLTDIIFKNAANDNVHVKSLADSGFCTKNFIGRVFGSIVIRRFIPYLSLLVFFIKRKFLKDRGISRYKNLVVVGVEDLSVFKNIYRQNYQIENLIFWQWNPSPKRGVFKILDFYIRLLIMKSIGFNIATFDQLDAVAYNISYYPQIYSLHLASQNKSKHKRKNENRAVFLGSDKGRLNRLSKIACVLLELDVNVDFKVISDAMNLAPPGISILTNQIGYDEYVKSICESEYIVEVIQDGQDGLTLRALESLFYGLKLITDNVSIKSYDFYNKNNIYIYNPEKNECEIKRELIAFINSNYEEIGNEIIQQYDVNSLVGFLTQEKINNDD